MEKGPKQMNSWQRRQEYARKMKEVRKGCHNKTVNQVPEKKVSTKRKVEDAGLENCDPREGHKKQKSAVPDGSKKLIRQGSFTIASTSNDVQINDANSANVTKVDETKKAVVNDSTSTFSRESTFAVADADMKKKRPKSIYVKSRLMDWQLKQKEQKEEPVTRDVKRSQVSRTVIPNRGGVSTTFAKPKALPRKSTVNIGKIPPRKSILRKDSYVLPSSSTQLPLVRPTVESCEMGPSVSKKNDPDVELKPPEEEKIKSSEAALENILEDRTGKEKETPKNFRKPKNVLFNVKSSKKKGAKRLPKTPLKSMSSREKLDSWLAAKGHTPSNYHHLRCFGIQLSEVKKAKRKERFASNYEVNDGSPELKKPEVLNSPADIKISLRDTLFELKALLFKDFPTPHVEKWLQEIHATFNEVQKLPLYWECCSVLEEKKGNPFVAINILEKAVDLEVEPVEDIQAAINQLMSRIESKSPPHQNESEASAVNRTPSEQSTPQKLEQAESPATCFSSTLIKYSVKKRNPHFKRLVQALDIEDEISAIVTPVRRSARLQKEDENPVPVHLLVSPERQSMRLQSSKKTEERNPAIVDLPTLESLPQSVKKRMLFRNNNNLF